MGSGRPTRSRASCQRRRLRARTRGSSEHAPPESRAGRGKKSDEQGCLARMHGWQGELVSHCASYGQERWVWEGASHQHVLRWRRLAG